MTAIPEIATTNRAHVPDVPAPRDTIEQRELPSMLWPFNFGVLRSPQTKILNSLSDEGPGVTIITPPNSAFSVRAPISTNASSKTDR